MLPGIVVNKRTMLIAVAVNITNLPFLKTVFSYNYLYRHRHHYCRRYSSSLGFVLAVEFYRRLLTYWCAHLFRIYETFSAEYE